MSPIYPGRVEQRFLTYEGGATRTRAGMYDDRGELLGEAEGGPCNPCAYGFAATIEAMVEIGEPLLDHGEGPMAVLAGIAGATPEYQRRLGRALCMQLGAVRAVVTADTPMVLYANTSDSPGILAIAGTGSSVWGMNDGGRFESVGGRGAIFGDEGSGYKIAVEALRLAAHAVDGVGIETVLTERLPVAAGVESFDDLTGWSSRADKEAIADLAREVERVAVEERDPVARGCIEDQARKLAAQIVTAQKRLGLRGGTPLYIEGGLYRGCALFRDSVARSLDAYSSLRPRLPDVIGHRAALALRALNPIPLWATEVRAEDIAEPDVSSTERRLDDTPPIDLLSADDIVAVMCREDAKVAPAVAAQHYSIAAAIRAAADSLQTGGRLAYFGAGTSGRLGVLDASEIPPTFGLKSDVVCAIIAGGSAAIVESIEGAEDDGAQAEADIVQAEIGASDTVVGIAASGTTPYVVAALAAAEARGATTVLLTCNPACETPAQHRIVIDTGAEGRHRHEACAQHVVDRRDGPNGPGL